MNRPVATAFKTETPVRALSVSISRQQLIQCMEQHQTSLLAYSSDFVGHHNAHDIVQEAFISLLAYKKPISNIRAWLFKVCRHKSIDLIRKGKTMHHIDTIESAGQLTDTQHTEVSDALTQSECSENIQQVLQMLPLRQQEILRLKFHENMSYQSIADITGLSASNVGFILHSVLKSLRNHSQIQGMQS